MKNPSLHARAGHALVVFSLAGLAIGTAACDNGMFLVTTASPVRAAATISPSPIALTSFSGFGCSVLVVGASFNMIVVAGGQDLTVDSVTLHMIDGTNVGGPSVTIPSPQLNAQFGTTIVPAGTTRVFPLQPVFGCSRRRPHSLTATVFLMDQRGRQHTVNVTAPVG